jgi:hypothetical protein
VLGLSGDRGEIVADDLSCTGIDIDIDIDIDI